MSEETDSAYKQIYVLQQRFANQGVYLNFDQAAAELGFDPEELHSVEYLQREIGAVGGGFSFGGLHFRDAKEARKFLTEDVPSFLHKSTLREN